MQTVRSYNPDAASPPRRFGLFPVRSPLLRESLSCFLFLGVLRCFSSPGLPPYICVRIAVLQTAGLSHSEIPGSMVICTYPELIAAYHVLPRLREPRHPPCALFFFAGPSPLSTVTAPQGTARLAEGLILLAVDTPHAFCVTRK